MISKFKRKIKRITKTLLFQARKPPPVSPPKRQQEYSIGIYIGESPLHWLSPENVDNPVLRREDVSDVPAAFVADPFMLKVKGTWYMLFEVWNGQSHKGEIGLATSEDGRKWTYRQIVLAETFHLSYPYVFEWMNDYYMIPETQQAESVRLYRASAFPIEWSCVATLLSRPFSEAHLADPSIFRHDGKWWLFTRANSRSKPAALSLYYADDLVGPWHEHPRSPVVTGNIHITRPAGRVVPFNGKIVRYAQDSYPVYGTQVRACEITELTADSYREREARESPVLMGSGTGWNASGMHHIDAHVMEDGRWIACVDGWTWIGAENRDAEARV